MALQKPSGSTSDRVVRIQILVAFLVPVLVLGLWLGSRGFFSAP